MQNVSKYILFIVLSIMFIIITSYLAYSQTNIATSATVTHSGGGSAGYGPSNYKDGVIPSYGNTPWGWTTTNGWILFTWSSSKTINLVKFYKDNRPMTTCTFQYWNGSSYVNFYTYNDGTIEHTVNFSNITTTRIRFDNIAGNSNPNFREIQIFEDVCAPPTTVTAFANNSSSLTIINGNSITLTEGTHVGGSCSGGSWQYRWRIGGTTVRDWSTTETYTTTPSNSTTYTLDMRCSACSGSYTSDNVTVTLEDFCVANLANLAGSGGVTGTSTVPSGVTETFSNGTATLPSPSGGYLGRTGGINYSYTSSSWPTCINWGVPTTVAACNLNNNSPTCIFENLVFDAGNTETNLDAGKACFTGSDSYRCLSSTWSWTSKTVNVRMRIVATKSDGVTALPIAKVGNYIMVQADENFKINVIIEVNTNQLGSCAWVTSSLYNTGWRPAVEVFDALHTDPNYLICTQFTPYWYTVNSSPTASSNSPVCETNTLNLNGSSSIGSGCYFNWTGPNGFSSILEDPSITGITTAAAGTYNLVISDGKACYGTTSTSVIINTNSTDPISIDADVNP